MYEFKFLTIDEGVLVLEYEKDLISHTKKFSNKEELAAFSELEFISEPEDLLLAAENLLLDNNGG